MRMTNTTKLFSRNRLDHCQIPDGDTISSVSQQLLLRTDTIGHHLLIGLYVEDPKHNRLVATASPFAWRAAGQATGPGLAPALQDPAIFLHLPLLALGAAGLAVVFALAAAALLPTRVDPGWARQCRPWALGAWLFLTAGIGIGSFWTDGKTGWGGWWPWEPLPAAHLVSWLAATALLHLLPVAERRRLFVREPAWPALLPFALALLGAWLVRAVPAGTAFPYAFGARQETAFLFLFAAASGGVLRRSSRATTKAKSSPVRRRCSRATPLGSRTS